MKLHLKSIAALFSVFLALGGWNLPVRAQAPSMLYPYYFTETLTPTQSIFSIVLRFFGTDQEYNLTGAYMVSTIEAGLSPFSISAKFDASTNTFSGLVHSPPAIENDTVTYNVQGTYDPLRDRFAIQFMLPGDQSPQFIFERIDAYADPNPLMVGIWQWAATDPNHPNLPFKGDFYVYQQTPSGSFAGQFSMASAQDVGLLLGQVAAPSKSFTFTRYNQEGTFIQIWNGFVVTNNTVLQGAITRETPTGSDLTFVAETY